MGEHGVGWHVGAYLGAHIISASTLTAAGGMPVAALLLRGSTRAYHLCIYAARHRAVRNAVSR